MRLTLGLLAEAANLTVDNKINILGEFNVIRAAGFPFVFPSLTLVIRIEADGDAGKEHAFHIRLLDDDGNLVRPLADGAFVLTPSEYEGVQRRVQGIIPLALATFERPGTYTFEVLVDNQRIETPVPIEVHVVPMTPA